MQSCQEIEVVLTDYLFDELSEAEMAEVMLHLALCPGCRMQLAELEQAVLVLHSPHHQVPVNTPAALSADRLAAILDAADHDASDAPIPVNTAADYEASDAPAPVNTAVEVRKSKIIPAVWLAVAAIALLAIAATMFLAILGEGRTPDVPGELLAHDPQPDPIAQVVRPENTVRPESMPTPSPIPVAPAPQRMPEASGPPETLAKTPLPESREPERLQEPPPPPQEGALVRRDPARQTLPPEAPERPATRPEIPPAPPHTGVRREDQIVRREPVPAPAPVETPTPAAPRTPAPPPNAFAWTRDLQNRLLVRNQPANLLVAVSERDTETPLNLQSRPPATAHLQQGTLAEVLRAARLGSLILETDPSGYVLTRQEVQTRSYRRTAATAAQTVSLAGMLEAIGDSMPEIRYNERQQQIVVRGTFDQIRAFYEVLGVAQRRKRSVRIGPRAAAGYDPNAPSKRSFARRPRDRSETGDQPGLAGIPPAAASPPKGGTPPSTSSTTGGSEREITVRTPSEGQTAYYPETSLGSPLKNLTLTDVSPRDAIARIAEAGKLDVRYRAGQSDLRLAIFSREIAPVDALHLICRAADLQLEINGDRIQISRGPYEPRVETRMYRLSRREIERIFGKDAVPDPQQLQGILNGHGLSLPPGAAAAYESKQEVLIIRSSPEDLEFFEYEVLR